MQAHPPITPTTPTPTGTDTRHTQNTIPKQHTNYGDQTQSPSSTLANYEDRQRACGGTIGPKANSL